ncbi:MAG: PorT family protein [Muribaculaceae bacterium]|nr:PorT family protein [Muribaculaceae bacterium]
MKLLKTLLVILVAGIAMATPASARTLNDKLQNRPYADLRKWHLGFSVGAFTSGLNFTHNGYEFQPVDANGNPEGAPQLWRAEQPAYQPGFCVNGLIDLRLNNYFSLRFTPGLYFGSRDISMRDLTTGATERQNIKSAFVVLPIDVKFAALRYRNARPYVVGGVMPSFDVTKKSSDFLRLNTTDFYLTVGFGCDFYLPFFKLNPEIKFCFGLTDVLVHDRPDLTDDINRLKITQSLSKVTSKMIVLTFYFE